MPARKKLAVFKFASCDGCQLSLLDCEDELLLVAQRIEIAHFLEASSRVIDGPYDLTLVEGSISTPADLERIQEVRRESRTLVTIGACANAGGIQALRNTADSDFASVVYPRPDYIASLAQSTPVASHVVVDYELQGCPVNKAQLLEVILAFLHGRKPNVPRTSVCAECKGRGNACITVAAGTPCMGPVTQSGCGALCPSYNRGCYGCFGPKENANTAAIRELWRLGGMGEDAIRRNFAGFTAWAPAFRKETER
jgi:sulfhydrogenase subunit delta